jgi:DNA primase catalytic subunit
MLINAHANSTARRHQPVFSDLQDFTRVVSPLGPKHYYIALAEYATPQ